MIDNYLTVIVVMKENHFLVWKLLGKQFNYNVTYIFFKPSRWVIHLTLGSFCLLTHQIKFILWLKECLAKMEKQREFLLELYYAECNWMDWAKKVIVRFKENKDVVLNVSKAVRKKI